MEGILRTAALRGGSHGPIGYREPASIWVFAGSLYRASPLLILRRRLPDVVDVLPGLVWRWPDALLVELAVRYADREPTEMERWDEWDLRDYIGHLLATGRIKLYQLDADESGRLYDPEDPLFNRPEHWRGTPPTLPGAVQQQRLTLAEELGAALLVRWRHTVTEDLDFWSATGIGQQWRLLCEVGEAAADMAAGAWEGFVGLARLGGASLSATAEALWIELKLIAHPTEVQLNQAARDLRALGFDLNAWGERIDEKWQGTRTFLAGATELLELLYADPWTRRILWNYLVGLYHSRPYVERETETIRLTLTFTLGELAALKAAHAGRSLAAAARNGRIGRFTAEAMEHLGRLARLLEKAEAQKADNALPPPRRRPDGPEPEPVTIGDPRLMPSVRSPHPGLHNQQWQAIKAKKFRPRRTVDMNDLSESDRLAVRQLEENGWHEEKVEEILNSGRGAHTKDLESGQRLYGFTSKGFPKNLDKSPYWLDEEGFEALAAKHYRDGAWDREAVKNELALPCYNRADAIDVAEVTEPQTAVESTIGRATELISYTDETGSTELTPKLMSGGGTQIAPDPSKLTSVVSQKP